MKHLITLKSYTEKDILNLISLAQKIKRSPNKYRTKLKNKSLLMLFAKPSLRTHLSFDLAMHQLGGHAIFYDLKNSSIGKKESWKDASRVMSRYVDVIMARLYEHKTIEELAKYSTVPVINGLTDNFHPCQILGDLLTIKEKFRRLRGLKLTYIGDANNNVTNSLIIACPKVGIKLNVVCPKKLTPKLNGTYSLSYDPKDAKGDIIYTDTHISYHIPKSQHPKRIRLLKPFQVDKKLLKKANFMHCLPAQRNIEVTDQVIDSKQSLVYDQAYNRLPIQQAILLKLLK